MSAGFAQRFVAYVVDGILLGCAVLVLWLVAAALGTGAAAASEDSPLLGIALLSGLVFLVPIIALFGLVYFGYFWSKSGQTPGMSLMKIKVVRRDGSKQSFFRGGLRGTLGYAISGFFFELGFIWAAFDANQEAWHDKIFDTRVTIA